MKSAITISLVSEAAGGPFVFWHDIAGAFARAEQLGFDGIEVFPPDANFPERDKFDEVRARHNLRIAAMGAGAGWVKHKLTFTSPDAGVRERAKKFVREMITTAAGCGAPVIIGSMQGRVEAGVQRSQAVAWFREAVEELAEHSASKRQTIFIEPLNRYETNMLNTVQQGLEFVGGLKARNVKLLLDLFHMNIEEQNLAASIRLAGENVGHVHLADSNRRAAGMGHLDLKPVIAALREINYTGYLSGEILPLPTSDAAAAQTISAYKALVG